MTESNMTSADLQQSEEARIVFGFHMKIRILLNIDNKKKKEKREEDKRSVK